MQDGERELRDDVLGRDEVDIVHVAHLLQLEVPLAEFLGGEVEAGALLRDVVVLAEAGYDIRQEGGSVGGVDEGWTWCGAYTQRKLQPEKKTEPEPRWPWIHGFTECVVSGLGNQL